MAFYISCWCTLWANFHYHSWEGSFLFHFFLIRGQLLLLESERTRNRFKTTFTSTYVSDFVSYLFLVVWDKMCFFLQTSFCQTGLIYSINRASDMMRLKIYQRSLLRNKKTGETEHQARTTTVKQLWKEINRKFRQFKRFWDSTGLAVIIIC